MYELHYAIDLITGAAVSNETYAISNGTFRWVTDLPGYDGSPTYPKWEDLTNNTSQWYEGWLAADGIGTPSRRVDINSVGDYGTLSGFSFSVINKGFSAFVEDNSINLLNKPIRLFAVIDDIFYQLWDGIVADVVSSDETFEFTCQDSAKKIHKDIPPTVISQNNYPNADRESYGEYVPIVIGQVPYANLVKINNEKTFIPLMFNGAEKFYTCQASAYDYADDGTGITRPRLRIVTSVPFQANDLAGYYIVAVSGEGANKDRFIRIRSNLISTEYNRIYSYTYLFLDEPLDAVTPTPFNLDSNNYKLRAVSGTTPADENSWWFSITSYQLQMTSSNASTITYKKDDNNQYQIFKYDKDTGQYTSLKGIISSVKVTAGKLLITLKATSLTADGEIVTYVPVEFKVANATTLSDCDRTTMEHVPFSSNTNADITNFRPVVGSEYQVKITDANKFKDIDNLYLTCDMNAQTSEAYPGGYSPYVRLMVRYKGVDVYGRDLDFDDTDSDYILNIFRASQAGVNINFIPNEYYIGGDDNDETDLSGAVQTFSDGSDAKLMDQFKFPEIIKSCIENGIIRAIKFQIGIRQIANGTSNQIRSGDLRFKELAMLAQKNLPIVNADLYASTYGEMIDGVPSQSVYDAFRLILETYDGIGTGSLDYGNLATTRKSWIVARQLTEHKSSQEYLKELAQQSYVCIFPTRTGKRKMQAWRDISLVSATHSASSILRDSLRRMSKTPSSMIYNAFTVNYNWNPATSKYERSLKVDFTDQTSFPVSTGAWQSYVSGVAEGSYADAKIIWDIAHDGYLRSSIITPLPDQLQNASWYADQAAFNGTTSVGASVDCGAWKYLTNLCEWCTRQKDVVEYAIPLTAANLQLDLCDRVTVNDLILTDSADRTGWITKVDIQCKNDQIVLTVMLNPPELEDASMTDNLIIESGDRVDYFGETGAWTDTYTEGAQV
jgi:hypothetical protein